jgi:integrase
MKMHQDHVVPLSEPALTILDKMRDNSEGELIFPNPDDRMFSENAMLAVLDRLGYSPRQPAGVHAAKPVARGLDRRVGHRLLRTAGGSTRLANAHCLNWRTGHRAVGAEHAAIARLWL